MDESDGASEEGPDPERVQHAAAERQHERTEHVETILAEVRDDLGDRAYPVSSSELASVYADQAIDLPNETESLGSVFRRLDETFEDESAAYEALLAELSAGEQVAVRANAADPEAATWDEERAETQHEFREDPIPDEDYESSVERSRERAREAQAEAESDERREE